MQSKAILIGNSDGIGLATTKRLLTKGWSVIGVSRRASSVTDPRYQHHVADVSEATYAALIHELAAGQQIDLCIYFAGIGGPIDLLNMDTEVQVIDVNFGGMVKTAAGVVPPMVKRGQGHFIGLSSLADELISPEAVSYCASKAGFSSYLRSLALALKPKGVFVTNIRFGFVDTKMAKSPVKPFMMSVEKAVDHVERCIAKKPARYTAPWIMIPLVKAVRVVTKLRAV